MVESAPAHESATSATAAAPSPEEVAEVISQLEEYRDRLIEDFTTTAKKAKLPKSMVMAQLKTHPEIAKIEASLAQLRGQEPSSQMADQQTTDRQTTDRQTTDQQTTDAV